MENDIQKEEKVYVIYNFCTSTRKLWLSKQIKYWRKALEETINIINNEISSYNNIVNYFKIDYVKNDDIEEMLNNNQSFKVGTHIIGIKDITPEKLVKNN